MDISGFLLDLRVLCVDCDGGMGAPAQSNRGSRPWVCGTCFADLFCGE